MSVIRWTDHRGHQYRLSVGGFATDLDECRLDLTTPDGPPACSNLTRQAAMELHEALGDFLDECAHPTVDVTRLDQKDPERIPACPCDQEPYQ